MSIDISVIIPAFNAEKWIDETLQSVETERWDGVETIVVDDGSTDATYEIAKSKHPWVRLVKQKNQGCSAARSHGTAIAEGKYIKYLDADDLLVPGVLRRQLGLIETSNADVVYGNWRKLIQGESGNWIHGPTILRSIQDVSNDCELAFYTHMWCTTAAYLWSAEFLRLKHPGWHPHLPVIQDARFAFDAAAANARFVHDQMISSKYRVQSSNSVSSRSRVAFAKDCLRNSKEIYEEWKKKKKLTSERLNAVLNHCEDFGFSVYAEDAKLAREFFEFAKYVDAHWRPRSSFARSVVSRVFGTTAAAEMFKLQSGIRSRLRSIKSKLLRNRASRISVR